ncbi:MAG: DUF3291 domain-containing protein [Bryobacteraceae bacterium]|nr:DUF3291 domain-containing protein [Bryobacteraceae bacterium]
MLAGFELAQINIGRLLAPIDDPMIAAFVAELDSINMLAEESAGFVWRLKSDSGNATDLPYNDDPLTIVNMSVWTDAEALREFTYKSRHVEVFRQRKHWFETAVIAHYCLWWVPAGHRPSVVEGKERLEHYQRFGPTQQSFWFSHLFPAPEISIGVSG